MKKLMIKPYALLIVVENLNYRIVRYNFVNKDWDILGDIYTNESDAQIEVDKLNEETGLIQLELE